MPSTAAPYILLADDDQELRATLERFSARAGWRFDLAEDGENLLDAAAGNEYDVIVTDYVSQKDRGIPLLRELRQRRPSQAVIAIAVNNSVDDAVAILREGVSDYLLRPLDFDALKSSVERVLHGKRKQGAHDSVYRFVEAQSTSLTFTSRDIAEGRGILLIIEKPCRAGKISLETKLRLDLAYQEALANSLEHGNLELRSCWKEQFDAEGIDRFSREKASRLADPVYADRAIRLLTHYRPNRLTIVIEDQGHGFLADESQQKLSASSELLCHGRGLAIMMAVMDEVTYSRRGTRVKMVKYL